MTRTDIHREAHKDFDPEDYECAGVFDLKARDDFPADHEARIQTIDLLKQAGYQMAAIQKARGMYQCGHCGSHITYAALMKHTPSMELIYVGEQCLTNRFESQTKASFKELRKQRAALARYTREQGKLAAQFDDSMEAAVDVDPIIECLRRLGPLTDENPFLFDLRFKMHHRELTERQIEAAAKSIRRAIAWKLEREAEAADLRPAPSGKVEVNGIVQSVKYHENDFGGAWKMVVKSDESFKVWATIPSKLWDQIREEVGPGVNPFAEDFKGRRVTFTATLEVSDRDETFAFAKRPSKAKLHPAE